MNSTKPIVVFVPVTMKLFWQLYPDLQERTAFAQEAVADKLRERFDVTVLELVGNEEEARQAAEQLRHIEADLLIIWESGYVASAIPSIVIKSRLDLPLALLITQRDKEAPLDMDYPRYMESTAITSAMELGGALTRTGIAYQTLVGHMDETEVYDKLELLGRAARTSSGLNRLNMALIGYAYPGMLDISIDEAGIAAIGVSLRRITLLEVEEALKEVKQTEVDAFLTEVRAECDYSRVTEADLQRTARLYRALEALVGKYGLGALTVHDYDCLSTVSKTVSDFALSYLENRYGLATGVEGDMLNCVSAFVARSFSGQSPMFVDWTMFDEVNNALFLQHNGKADPAIVANPVLSPSPEPFGGVVGNGVVFEASGKPGPVTMVSMFYRSDGWHIFAAEGEAIAAPARPCGLNQMTVRIDAPVKSFLEQACDMGLGHHLNVAYGHFAEGVKLFARLRGIPYHTVALVN